MRSGEETTDILIIGSGVAGLTMALRLPARFRVTLLAKGPMAEGASLYAQGGVSAVLEAGDSIDAHVADTLEAGAGLCDPAAVRQVAGGAPEAVRWLLEQQVPFTTRPGDNGEPVLHLHQEGGHSHRRIVHAADHTGRAIETTLLARALERPNIRILENQVVVDLITARRLGHTQDRCLGAYVLDVRHGGVHPLAAGTVVLACGGASKAYLYSTNPEGATGDGIAMAWRAGCRVANLEFNQFHPTCLFHPRARSFLISEAVRGEGGRLLLPSGEAFMKRFDPRGELASRDIVARAIDHEMKRLGADCVQLDISHRPAEFIREHFPTIHGRCLELGIDITREPIPVVPAAHYTCGGILVDGAGRTDLAGLYAIGETACTGLHGANRLASNSLLECLVYGMAAAAACDADLATRPPPAPALPPWDDTQVTDSDEQVVVAHNWLEIRRCMWDYVGIVRTDKRLARARRRIDLLQGEIDDYYGNFRVTPDLIELRNLALVAGLMVESAAARRESRGLHYTLDCPAAAPGSAQSTILVPPAPRPYAGAGGR